MRRDTNEFGDPLPTYEELETELREARAACVSAAATAERALARLVAAKKIIKLTREIAQRFRHSMPSLSHELHVALVDYDAGEPS